MVKLRVASFSISIDGYGAGVNQSLENPMGIMGQSLHDWAFATETIQKMFGNGSGSTGIDNDFAKRGFENIGAWILGRNMFGPIRGDWLDDNWKGWWGENPPYHVDVFVLTNYKREPLKMEGGTTFYFVNHGIYSALELAKKSANGRDIRIGGGVNTIKQYLIEKLIDELHIAVSPVLLGKGENLFDNINLVDLGYKCVENVPTEKAMHLVIKKL